MAKKPLRFSLPLGAHRDAHVAHGGRWNCFTFSSSGLEPFQFVQGRCEERVGEPALIFCERGSARPDDAETVRVVQVSDSAASSFFGEAACEESNHQDCGRTVLKRPMTLALDLLEV